MNGIKYVILSILIHYNCIKLQKEHEMIIHNYNARRLLNLVIEYCLSGIGDISAKYFFGVNLAADL